MKNLIHADLEHYKRQCDRKEDKRKRLIKEVVKNNDYETCRKSSKIKS